MDYATSIVLSTGTTASATATPRGLKISGFVLAAAGADATAAITITKTAAALTQLSALTGTTAESMLNTPVAVTGDITAVVAGTGAKLTIYYSIM